MASPEKWATPTDRGNVLSTELNAVADGAWTAEGSAYDNTGGDVWAVVEFANANAFGSAPTDQGQIDVYINPNIASGGHDTAGSRGNPEYAVASIPLHAQTAAQTVKSKPFILPPGQLKFRVQNNCGQTTPATGNTLKLYTFNKQVG